MRIDDIVVANEIASVENNLRKIIEPWKQYHPRTFEQLVDKLTNFTVDVARYYGDYPSGV